MRYFFTQDDSAHWYMIPEDLRPRWQELMLKMESRDEDEAYAASDLIDAEFRQHMTGGGISRLSFLDPHESKDA